MNFKFHVDSLISYSESKLQSFRTLSVERNHLKIKLYYNIDYFVWFIPAGREAEV